MNASSTAGDLIGHAQRILVIDDDPAILRLVQEKLTLSGYNVLPASSGQEGLELIKKHGLPHLAVVDLMMPGMSGFDFCRAVQEFSDLPVIMLTAIDEEETVIQGLELYAEDYITKPFSPRELVARVQRVLRRIGDFTYALGPQIQIDDHLTVDFTQQQAIVDGKVKKLTPIETKLLYILLREAGRAVTSGFLLRRLWPLDEVYEDTLRVHIYRLRRKIEADPANPRYIVTRRGIGYSFEK